MKTVVWAALTANGNYARGSTTRIPPRQTLEDFAAHAEVAGNFISGRRTLEAFLGDPSRSVNDRSQAFASTTIVVVSRNDPGLPGVLHATSPAAALALLEQRGYTSALVGGGETLINSFLADDLVDELAFNVVPVLEDEGLHLVLPKEQYRHLRRTELRDLGDGIVHLHYVLDRRPM